MFVITREWLERFSVGAGGGWFTITKDAALAVGESYPLMKGWMIRLEGKEISEDQKSRFELQLRVHQVRDANIVKPPLQLKQNNISKKAKRKALNRSRQLAKNETKSTVTATQAAAIKWLSDYAREAATK